MAAKAKSEAATVATPLPLSLEQEPWILERLALDPRVDKRNNRDGTTALCSLWKRLRDDLAREQAKTFSHAVLRPDGKIEIADPEGLASTWNSISSLRERLEAAEAGIRRIIDTGGEYLHELENKAYAYGNAETHIRRRLDVCYRNLQIQHKDLAPDAITKLPEYINLKKELDAEVEAGNKILAEAREKIAIYTAALEAVGI